MGNLWLLIAAPATVLAAILFWRVFDVQQGEYQTHRAEVRADRAKFDADFAKAFDGKTDVDKEAKAKAAALEMGKIKSEQEQKKKMALEDGQKSVNALDKLLNSKEQ